MGPYGVLLMAFGGPDSPEAVEPFITNLTGGRRPPPALRDRVIEKYRRIGGKSPLLEITLAQARALEDRLGQGFRVYVGMRYWHPFIEEALAQIARDGVRQAAAISLSPHYSRVSTGAYTKEIEEVIARCGLGLRVKVAEAWYDHPAFIEALAEKFLGAFYEFPEDRRQDLAVVFSAHSLPLAHIEQGDPYLDQLRATISALLDRVSGRTGRPDWRLAFQSKGGGQGQWLEPEVETVLDELTASGRQDVLLVPVGFVADHIETLYDIDIAIREYAEAIGLEFRRSASLNASPLFIEALADIARKTSEVIV